VRVRLGAGTGVEWLVAAIAVADPDWRPVFSRGEEAYDAWVAAGGSALARDVRWIGRHGWTRLLGPLTRVRGAWSVEALRAEVAAMTPQQLQEVLVRPRRAPDRARALCLTALDTLPAPATRAPALARIRARLAEVGPQRLLDEVAPGLHYGPGVLDDVVLVTSPQVAPIVVELAEESRTVIVHPPLDESGATDAGARLRELGRALGDATRVRVLQELKGRERTLPELCDALEAPRTTLLHHLAMLRGAGFIDLSVTAGEPNVYRLRPEGFERLAQAATAFPLR
jgi:DNA-binding transcriptional ArsR family regulator